MHEPARSFGDVFALHAMWQELGFDRALGRALRSGKRRLDVEALVRAIVFNRLCDPSSKLGCLRWLETVAMPAMPDAVTHQHLLRAMDALMDHAERVEMELAKQIRPLVDRDLAVVFYDLTTVRIHGEGAVEDDIRAFFGCRPWCKRFSPRVTCDRSRSSFRPLCAALPEAAGRYGDQRIRSKSST